MVTTIPATRQRLTPPVNENRDHLRGSDSASVTLTEYGDYECPFCRAAEPVVLAVMDELGDGVRQAFRHFPISTIHPHAQRAAEAAEAAGAQGQFWSMHESLFTSQGLNDHDLLRLALELGLDLDRFEQDMRTHRHEARIREDFLSGIRSGVNGTPTFFINGVRHDGPWDFDSLAAAILTAGDQTHRPKRR